LKLGKHLTLLKVIDFGAIILEDWGPLSLMSTTEELLERKSSGSVVEI
jgi:hypothetical protein